MICMICVVVLPSLLTLLLCYDATSITPALGEVHNSFTSNRVFAASIIQFDWVTNYYGGPYSIGPMVHIKNYTFTYFYQQYLVLLITTVPRTVGNRQIRGAGWLKQVRTRRR